MPLCHSHFLDSCFFLCLFAVHAVIAQHPGQPGLAGLHNFFLHGAPHPHQALFERIAPLEGLHVLHQAVAVTPLPHTDPPLLARLDLLRQSMSTVQPVNHRFFTVTVPTPIYNPSHPPRAESIGTVIFSKSDLKAEEIKTAPTSFVAPTSAPHLTPHAEVPVTDETQTVPTTAALLEQLVNESLSTNTVNNANDIETDGRSTTAPETTTARTVTSVAPSEASTTESTTTTHSSTKMMTTIKIQKTTAAAKTTSINPSTVAPETTTASAETSENHMQAAALNSSDLDTFLANSKISPDEVQVFRLLVEKVLKEELDKRLREHKDEVHKETKAPAVDNESPKLAGIKLQPAEIQHSLDTSQSVKDVDDEYLHQFTDRRELKTVDMRLSYTASATPPEEEEEKQTSQLNLRINDRIWPLHSLTEHRLAKPKSTVAPKVEVVGGETESDYRNREQAAFDELISGLRATEPTATTRPAVSTTRRALTSATVSPKQSSVMDFQRNTVTHAGPSTQFERLAKDYQYRLSGQNGLNDLIKALRNAKIGFYERPTYRRYRNQS